MHIIISQVEVARKRKDHSRVLKEIGITRCIKFDGKKLNKS